MSWIGIGIVASLLACVLACTFRRRRLGRTAAQLGGMPLPVLPPLPGLDVPPRDDPLEAIDGVGPVVAELLRADGVRTFDDLALRGVARIRAHLQALGPERVGPADPASWAVQARWLAHGRFEAFASLVRIFDDGRVPLESICEPTQAWRPRRDVAIRQADALRAAGVHSVVALATQSDAAALARALRGVDAPVAQVAGWIERAILFERGDEAAYRGLLDPRIVARMDTGATPYPLTNEYRAELDRRTVAFSQAVVLEFDAATARWREGALRLFGRESERTCLACRWGGAGKADGPAGRRGR